MRLPAPRERPHDVPLLVRHLLAQLRETYQRPGLRVGAPALHWLQAQPLHGNIRELKNLVERAALVSGHNELTPADFQQSGNTVTVPSVPALLPVPGALTLD